MTQYDTIIIGAGHNGLVAAACLAKAGQKVLVLERRENLGGAAATQQTWPGFNVNTGAVDAGLLRPEVIAHLGLRSHGLEFIDQPVAVFAPHLNGPPLLLYGDPRRTQTELARLSPSDAEQWPAYLRQLGLVTGLLDQVMTLTPPTPADRNPAALLPWLKVGTNLKRLGKQDMMAVLRVLPLTVQEFLDDWFENEHLKGVLGAAGITATMQGPQSGGTAFTLFYHNLGPASTGFKSARQVRGGVGQITAALAAAPRQFGAEIRSGAAVARIVLANERAAGVALDNGEEIAARVVISNADPRATLFGLLGAPNLEPRAMRLVRNIRYRGCTAKVNLALAGLPHFAGQPDHPAALGGRIIISPSLEYLERAYDAAKYGNFSPHPYLEVTIPTVLDPSLAPAGKHVLSVTMQYAPYHLQAGDWDTRREELGDKIIDTLARYAPDLPGLILHRQVITPLDWERDYGLTAGDIYHGQMGLDQFLFMRPIAGYAQYRTPVDGLYLCGAGAHPGGGLTGAPGYNAAREVLKDLKR